MLGQWDKTFGDLFLGSQNEKRVFLSPLCLRTNLLMHIAEFNYSRFFFSSVTQKISTPSCTRIAWKHSARCCSSVAGFAAFFWSCRLGETYCGRTFNIFILDIEHFILEWTLEYLKSISRNRLQSYIKISKCKSNNQRMLRPCEPLSFLV